MTTTHDLIARLRKAIELYDSLMSTVTGCSDGGCMIRTPEGMHTNGGCRCHRDGMKTQRVLWSAKQLREALDVCALETLQRERDELRAARIAYASEFAPNGDGEPDVGNIHANIRKLKRERDEAVATIRDLQKALFYWMPSIAGEDSPAGQKAAEHASLLFGLDDSSTDCEGDRMMQSLRIRNQALERIELACRDAGCAEEMEFAEFIESLAGKDSVDATRDGFYLACYKDGRSRGVMTWWGPDNAGYTPYLEQAGVYTAEQIAADPSYYDNGHTVPVPVAFIDGHDSRQVDVGLSKNGQIFWSAKNLRTAISTLTKPAES